MWISEVDFPDTLLDAQKNGTLVIFAGAGVSIPPPSDYPNFIDLADRIAGGSIDQAKNEPIDHFLGRVAAEGGKVHQRAYDILSAASSKPNPLHFDLLKLFPSASQLRLVTTNFDIHFTTAAATVFGGTDPVEIFRAPALPLGHQFYGLVYLHGCVDKDPEDLVLTDSDFGRAYLTEGWARRCVQALFSSYTVLFVGYSHNDTVMNYLARGLPQDTPAQRFALTDEKNPERWKFLNITPISYPLKRKLKGNPNKHRALGEVLATWVDLSRMGVLDHEQRIQRIVQFPPPLDQEEVSYIENALKELSTVRFFTRHAKTQDWLRWAEDKGAFRELFMSNSQVDLVSHEFALWFANSFVCQYPNASLACIQRHGHQINPVLWHAIARELWRADPKLAPEMFAQWVIILLRFVPVFGFRDELLEYLLMNCRYPEDEASAVLLFEFLTRPRMNLRRGSRLRDSDEGERPVDMELSLKGDVHELEEAWKKLFRPNLMTFVEQLEPIVTSNLHKAHLLLKAAGKANDQWDPWSYSRAAIEPHEQNHHERDVGVLIDAAREILEWRLNHSPNYAQVLIDTWSELAPPLFKRLAIHGVTESTHLRADEKITWILERKWLYTFGLKHEVFRLLESAYPTASQSSRVHLLEQACRGPEGKDAENLEEKTRQYKIFNLLQWLYRAAPTCHFTEERLKTIQQAHPSFQPREYMDFDHWSSGVVSVGYQSPVTVKELLAKDPEEQVDFLLEESQSDWSGVGLLRDITEASSQDFLWSWQLVKSLQERVAWSTDLWTSLLSAWEKSSLTAEQWAEILTLLGDCTHLHDPFKRQIADLLERCTGRPDNGLPSSCLPLARDVARKIWDVCQRENTDIQDPARDWFTSAWKHPGGRIVLFWLKALSLQRAETDTPPTGIPEESRQFFDTVLSRATDEAELGRIILVSELYFLFTLEAEWVRDKVLPLLSWSRDKRQAQQAWHGFLFSGRWDDRLLLDLLPLYEETCSFLSELDGSPNRLREHFCEHLAEIAVYSSHNPIQHGWLGKFIAKVSLEDRKHWAAHIGHILRSLSEEAKGHLWERWMREYWQRRITGVPPLEAVEVEEMVKWTVRLDPVFPEATQLICESPAPALKHSLIYHELVKSNYAETQPEALTQLLAHLLKREISEPFWYFEDLGTLVQRLAASSAPRSPLLAICNELGRLGYGQAAELKRLVET